jgi:hypothetical protein
LQYLVAARDALRRALRRLQDRGSDDG